MANGDVSTHRHEKGESHTAHRRDLVASSLGLGGCAAPLTSAQKRELEGYKVKGIALSEKDPAAGAWLGLLPGGGSFYTRHYGFGALNLLLWPFSILWDPVNGHQSAKYINYQATKEAVDKQRTAEHKALENQLVLGQVTNAEFVARRHEIDLKYSPTQKVAPVAAEEATAN
jgi:hypothetical protein